MGATAAITADGVWTEENDKLEKKLSAIEMSSKIRARGAKSLLSAEQTPEVTIANEIVTIKRQIAEMDKQRCKRRIATFMAEVPQVVFTGRTVFVAEDMPSQIRQLRRVGARVVVDCDNISHILSAEIYMVKSASKPPKLAGIACALTGGLLAGPSGLHDDRGSLDAYKPAIATRRYVWVSPAAAELDSEVADATVRATQIKSSKRQMLASLASFVEKVEAYHARPKRQRRPMEQLAFVSCTEKAAEFAEFRNALPLSFFWSFVQNRDVATSRSGVCGL